MDIVIITTAAQFMNSIILQTNNSAFFILPHLLKLLMLSLSLKVISLLDILVSRRIVKLVTDIIAQPLAMLIYASFNQGIFPDALKLLK